MDSAKRTLTSIADDIEPSKIHTVEAKPTGKGTVTMPDGSVKYVASYMDGDCHQVHRYLDGVCLCD